MKKLLFLLLLACSISCGMEQSTATEQEQTTPIYITEPLFNELSKLHEIQLLDAGNPIGAITYFPKNNQNLWGIYLFRVHRNYRRGALGTELFKACLNDIKAKGGETVMWEAMPTDMIIDLDTLITIYRHIIEKLGFASDALTISIPQGCGIIKQVVMTLRLS